MDGKTSEEAVTSCVMANNIDGERMDELASTKEGVQAFADLLEPYVPNPAYRSFMSFMVLNRWRLKQQKHEQSLRQSAAAC